MKGNKSKFIPCGGVDTQIVTPPSAASEIYNLRWDNKFGCWRSDMGLQPWWYPPQSIDYSGVSNSYEIFNKYAEAIYFWKKPDSGQTYHFLAMDTGELYVVLGNKGFGDGNIDDLEYVKDWYKVATLQPRKQSSAGVQFIPFGKKLLIIDGKSEMIWFEGLDRRRSFSFQLPTPKVDVIRPQSTYQQGSPLETGTGAPYFTDNQVQGLGDTAGDPNYYEYAFAYVTEDGAISPISPRHSVTWKVTQAGSEEYKYGLVVTLPECPDGTVSRYIYRTKNIKTVANEGANNHTLYFLKEIKENASTFYIDFYGDGNLTAQAETFASTVIGSSWKYGENWDGRLWLANDEKVIYSERGIPEQFGAANYFDLGNTFGGKITALKSFYSNIIVFRENAINIISLDNNGGYQLATITTSIGTRATNAIALAPEIGVIFPNEDGIWSISGTNQGGGTIKINKLSDSCDEEWKTANHSAMERMIAAYSIKHREYWIHYPAYYNTLPTQGLVLHTNKPEYTWSFRKPINAINEKLWWFAAMTTTSEGDFCFSSVPSWSDEFNLNSQSQLFGHLHVWCPSSQHGVTSTVTTVDPEGGPDFTINSVNKLNGKWVSSWIDFPEGSTRVYSVEVELIALGNTEMKLRYSIDYDEEIIEVTSQKMTESKVLFTTQEPAIGIETTTPDPEKTSKNIFQVATSTGEGTPLVSNRKVRLRFDVNTALANQFKFELEGDANKPMTLVGFKLNLASEATPRINQSTRLQRGQSR